MLSATLYALLRWLNQLLWFRVNWHPCHHLHNFKSTYTNFYKGCPSAISDSTYLNHMHCFVHKTDFFLLISVKTIITDSVAKYSIFLDASPPTACLILLVPGSSGSLPLKCVSTYLFYIQSPLPILFKLFQKTERNECYWTYTVRPARTMISKPDKDIMKKKKKGYC